MLGICLLVVSFLSKMMVNDKTHRQMTMCVFFGGNFVQVGLIGL